MQLYCIFMISKSPPDPFELGKWICSAAYLEAWQDGAALLATAGEEFARAEKLSRGSVISRSPGTLHITTFQFYSTASRWQGKSHKYDRDSEAKPVWFFVPGCVLSRASIHFSCVGGNADSKALQVGILWCTSRKHSTGSGFLNPYDFLKNCRDSHLWQAHTIDTPRSLAPRALKAMSEEPKK